MELNEDLGLYEMPFRQYDPAIGRFTSIDPVIHYEYSTYSAFDNNPVFFADPSGANSTSFIMDIFNNTPDDGLIHHYNSEGEETGTSDPDEESDDEGSENEDCCPGGMHPMGMYKAAESRAKMNGTTIEEEQKKLLGEYLDVQQEEGVDHITYAIPGGILLKVAFKGGSWIYRLYKGSRLIKTTKVSKLYSQATFEAFQKQLQQHGRGAIIKSQSKIQRRLNEHLTKLDEVKKAGGHTSSIEREINTFRSQLQAIQDLLK